MVSQDERLLTDEELRHHGLLASALGYERISAPTPAGDVSAIRWGARPASRILLHGAGLNAHTWDVTIAHAHQPALAVDLPGHGDSAWHHDADYRPRTNAGTLAQAITMWLDEGVVTAPVTIVGQSLGGLTAIALADLVPGLVSHVILVDIVPLTAGAAAQVEQFLSGPATFSSHEAVIDRARAFGFGGDPRSLDRAVRLNTRHDSRGAVVWKHHLARVPFAQAVLEDPESAWVRLSALPVPVDLIAGSRGLLAAGELARFSAERPHDRTVVIEAGHNVQEDAPEQLAAAIQALAPGQSAAAERCLGGSSTQA